MKINVHIEKLVLEGLPADRKYGALIQEVVEQELAELILTNGLAPSLLSTSTMSHLRAANIQLGPLNQPVEFGRQIAGSVFGEIGRTSDGDVMRRADTPHLTPVQSKRGVLP